MQISDEQLVSYLLGHASPQLAALIEAQLSCTPSLVDRLSELRFVVEQLSDASEVFEPPASLLENTLERIELADAGWVEHTSPEPHTLANGDSTLATIGLSAAHANRGKSSNFWDSTALAVSLCLLCCLALPAVIQARFSSRVAQCANNLRTTGRSLMDFAINDPGQRFPYVASQGPQSFAGVFAIRLHDAGFPIEPYQLRCASLIGVPVSSVGTNIGLAPFQSGSDSFYLALPTLAELETFGPSELRIRQATAGGNYAYNLGVREGEQIVAPKFCGRSHFAILADAPEFFEAASSPATQRLPQPQVAARDTDADSDAGLHVAPGYAGSRWLERIIAHDGRGSNILYEDGRVVFIDAVLHESQQQAGGHLGRGQYIGHPFRNDQGVHSIGLTPDDDALAPSHFRPEALGE